jgi:hypothetical protein
MVHYITQYYGSDWGGMFFTLLFLFLVGKKEKSAFIYGPAANLSWIIFAILAGSIANCIANLVFAYLNIRGYRAWSSMKE